MNDSETAEVADAMAHARSQSSAALAAPKAIPTSSATDLPPGITVETVRWSETIGTGNFAASRVRRGETVCIENLQGDTCVNLQMFNSHNTAESYNPADTVKVQWQAYLSTGSLLLSDMGRVLMTITSTTADFDALCGHSNVVTNAERYGSGGNHSPTPAARELHNLALARFELSKRDLTAGLNLFRSVVVAEDGGLELQPNRSEPSHVQLRAEMDLIISLAVAPHPLDTRSGYHADPVRVMAWGASQPSADNFRSATPECLRAFENTENYLLGLSE